MPDLKPLYETREEALAAPGDVRLHFKGGVYRKLEVVDTRTEGEPLAIYEHLWPHIHQIYVRTNEEFEGDKIHSDGRVECRFKSVTESS